MTWRWSRLARGAITGGLLGATLGPALGCERREAQPSLGDTNTTTRVARDLPTPAPARTTDALRLLLAEDSPPPPLDSATWARIRSLYGAPASAAPRWLAGTRRDADAHALLAALADAPSHALSLSPVAQTALTSAAAALDAVTDASARARADVLLTAVFTTYARSLLTGRIAPRDVDSTWYISQRTVDVDSALARAFHAVDVRAGLATLAPRDTGYASLREALTRYRAIVARGGWPTIAITRTLRPGDALPAGARLAARLAAEGVLDTTSIEPQATGPSSAPDTRGRYGGVLAGAVSRFQVSHGLAADSVLGPATRRALDVPASRRLAEIAASLERYRWLPTTFGARYVIVNIPAFRLEAFEDGRRVLDMPVVVGDELEARRTPVLADTMTYVQFGPFWNVPAGIAAREILPHARRDGEWFERNGFEVVRGGTDDAPVVDWRRITTADISSGRLRVRQRPGLTNALGRVKFMFPNVHDIYLHDTPARELFDVRMRAASHGCVRVGDPAALARFVLAGQDGWTTERIRDLLASGEPLRVDLVQGVPVFLVYFTAEVRNGVVVFRPDRYDHDDELIRALGDVPDGADMRAALRAIAERLVPIA